MKLLPIALASSALFVAPLACAAPITENATLELYPTYHAVGVEVAYTGDDDGDLQATMDYRLAGENVWREGVEMTFDRDRRKIWASVFRFEPGQKMDVRVTLTDPDAPQTRALSGAVTLRTPRFSNVGGRTYHVSATGKTGGDGSQARPFGSFARAVTTLKAGDTLVVARGTYRETLNLKNLRGTLEAPIVIRGEVGNVRAVDAPTSGQVDNYQPMMPLITGARAINANSGAWTRVEGDLWSADAPNAYSARRNNGYMSRNDLHLFRYPTVEQLRARPMDTVPEKQRSYTVELKMTRELRGDELESLPAWSHDAGAQKIYVYMEPGIDPNRDRFEYSTLGEGVVLENARNVVVRDLELSHFGNNAIDVLGDTSDCSIVNNLIHHNRVGVSMLSLASQGNAVWNNQIYDRGAYRYTWRTWMTNLTARDAAMGILASTGRGTSIVGNLVRGSFDAIKPGAVDWGDDIRGNRDYDIIDNVVANAADDSYELDGGGVNMRMLDNYSSNALEGLSAAPITLGPVYIVGNRAVSRLHGFKMMNNVPSLGATYMYHNTFLSFTGSGIRLPGLTPKKTEMLPFANKFWKNNIIQTQGTMITNSRAGATFDGNSYWAAPSRNAQRNAQRNAREICRSVSGLADARLRRSRLRFAGGLSRRNRPRSQRIVRRSSVARRRHHRSRSAPRSDRRDDFAL